MFWPGAGPPCLDNEKAFIFAAMSGLRPLALEGGGPGRRAAFVGPSGADEGVMLEVGKSFGFGSDTGFGGKD